MGFNLVDIVSKFINTKPHSSAADGWENPFGTGAGQIVVSSQENWKVRLARLGSTRAYYSGMTSTTAGVKTSLLACRAPKGTQCFLTNATISANGSGLAEMTYSVGNDVFSYRKYITIDNSFDVNFDGVFLLHNGSDFNLGFTPDNANTSFVCSAIWMEVNE